MYSNVMIIDDNAIDRFVAETVLKRSGIADNVISKESARSALDHLIILSETPEALPQVIFLDINMPEMNGFDFLDAFVSMPDIVKSCCDIMMLSSSLNPEDHEVVKGNRFVSNFISKPLSKDKLQALV